MNIKPDWLGITEQQFNILTIVHQLNFSRRQSKGKDIISEFENKYHSKLQRQNLFMQLKALMDKGLIKREGSLSYVTDPEEIKKNLLKNKSEKEKDLSECNYILTNFEKEFNHMINVPKVAYLEPDSYMKMLSNLVSQSSLMYADSPFPNISYSEAFYKSLHRKEFIESMKINCLKLKKIKINYLTNLVIDLTFRRALRIFKNPAKAYKECNLAIDKLEKELHIFPNLEIRYVEILPGPHMYIFENGETKDVILSLRGSNVPSGTKEIAGYHDPYGGIHVISPKIADEVKNIYLNSFDNAIPLKGKKGKALFDQTRLQLEKLYNQMIA